jgi:hypothetical protein
VDAGVARRLREIGKKTHAPRVWYRRGVNTRPNPALWLAALLIGPASAVAADTWTTPHPGIRHLARTTGRPWRIHALVVDLCAAGVSVRATADADHWRTVGSFADRIDAEAAINGDFFSYDTHLPTGLAIGNGDNWHGDMRGSGEILLGDDRAYLNPPGAITDPPAWAKNAVGGRPLLVDDGAVLDSFNRSDCADRHPRTAIGITEDRRKLILAVVDGRSNASIGMNCAELADLMDGLGAWRAMNLDGGGSTTMYLAGEGILNDPSDGNQRTVANHLGIQASGRGAPGSCAFDLAETIEQAHLMDAPGNSDLNGDGRADVCARASNGLHCMLSTGEAFEGLVRLPQLRDDDGFDAASKYATLRMGDIDADGRADVCARSAEGFGCWASTPAGFAGRLAGPDWSDDHGWANPKFYTTIRLADVTGDGRADVCGRTATDFRCHASTGVGFGEAVIGPPLSDEAGWGNPDNYGTIRMGDIDADGRADVCARANGGMRCWRAADAGFEAAAIEGPPYTDAAGYGDVGYWSTIRLEDIDSDGRADFCARAAGGYACHLSLGDAFGPAIPGPRFEDANGWGDHDNYGTIRLGDVNGDARKDICARSNDGLHCWLFDGAGFATRIDGPPMSDDHGWGNHIYNTTIRLADVTGDGLADVCARSSAGVSCWASDGATLTREIVGPRWTDANGWNAQKFFSTLRVQDRPRFAERCNGRDDDLDGETDEGCVLPDVGRPPPPDAGASAPTDAAPPKPGLDAGTGPGVDAGFVDTDAFVGVDPGRPDALRPVAPSEAGQPLGGVDAADPFAVGSTEKASYAASGCHVGPARGAAALGGLLVLGALGALGVATRGRKRRRC